MTAAQIAFPAGPARAAPPPAAGAGPFPFGWFDPREPQVTLDDDGRSITLCEPLHYNTAGGVTHTAPAGLRCDGASIPRALWSLVGSPYTGPYRLSSIMHDALCQQARALGGHSGWRLRRYADNTFGEMIQAEGGSAWRAGYMTLAVRIGAQWERLRGVYA